MVSVQHIIIEAAVPTRESGPKTLKISRRSAVAAEDESIFTAPSDISSAGKPLRRQMGDSRAIKPSIAPEALNIDTAHKRPRRDGRTENTVFMPLTAPSVKAWKMSIPAQQPQSIIIRKIAGRTDCEI